MTPAVVASALAAVVIWGASPVATRFAVADLPPIAVAVLRTLTGGLLIAPLLAWLRLPLPRRGRPLGLLLASAFCGFIGFPVLFSVGQQRTSAVHGSMILAFLPVMTGAIATLADRRWPAPRFWIGCGVAVAGEAVLVLARHAGSDGATLAGDTLILAAGLFASTGYVAGARLQQTGYPSRAATFWGVAAASLALLPALPWVLARATATPPGIAAWGGVLYLGVGVTIVGYVLWYFALGAGGIARVGLFQFLQPLSGLLLAALLLGERVGPGVAVAAALILAGVAIATGGAPVRARSLAPE